MCEASSSSDGEGLDAERRAPAGRRAAAAGRTARTRGASPSGRGHIPAFEGLEGYQPLEGGGYEPLGAAEGEGVAPEADATEAEAAEFVAAAARIEARLAEGDAAQDGAAEQAHVGDVEQRAPLRPAQPRGFEVDRARVLRLMQGVRIGAPPTWLSTGGQQQGASDVLKALQEHRQDSAAPQGSGEEVGPSQQEG